MLARMSDSLQSAQRSASEPDVARVKTVLVVDDVESERIAVRTAIESRTKFRVCGEASNGVEAIRQANELKPDLLLMDLAMPHMNGLEAAKVLRNTMPTVPVVLLTLHADLIGSIQKRRLGPTASLPGTAAWPKIIKEVMRVLLAKPCHQRFQTFLVCITHRREFQS